MNVSVSLCKTLKQGKVHSSINLSVNHAQPSHIATPPSFLRPHLSSEGFEWMQTSSPAIWGIHTYIISPCQKQQGFFSPLCYFFALFNLSSSFHHSFEWWNEGPTLPSQGICFFCSTQTVEEGCLGGSRALVKSDISRNYLFFFFFTHRNSVIEQWQIFKDEFPNWHLVNWLCQTHK